MPHVSCSPEQPRIDSRHFQANGDPWLKVIRKKTFVEGGLSRVGLGALDAMAHFELEEGHQFLLDWYKLKKVAACESPVVPVAVQHADTMEVLIVAYANEQAVTGKCGR